MIDINLPPNEYHEVGSAPLYPKTRHGFRRWAYFARHPILAFITYQKAYPDTEEETDRRSSVILTAIGFYLSKKFTGGHF
jgi:hypothetical protein